MGAREDATAIVLRQFGAAGAESPLEDELVVVDGVMIERSLGWVFFYTSKLWHRSERTFGKRYLFLMLRSFIAPYVEKLT